MQQLGNKLVIATLALNQKIKELESDDLVVSANAATEITELLTKTVDAVEALGTELKQALLAKLIELRELRGIEND